MTQRFTVLPAADRDLDEQADYLARKAGLATALRFFEATAATFETLVRMPGMGERRESQVPRLAGLRVSRVTGFENHLVFYRPAEGGIEIVRVLHGARDIDSVLDTDGESPRGLTMKWTCSLKQKSETLHFPLLTPFPLLTTSKSISSHVIIF